MSIYFSIHFDFCGGRAIGDNNNYGVRTDKTNSGELILFFSTGYDEINRVN